MNGYQSPGRSTPMFSCWLLSDDPPFQKLCLSLTEVILSVTFLVLRMAVTLQVLALPTRKPESESSSKPSSAWEVAARQVCDDVPGTQSPFSNPPPPCLISVLVVHSVFTRLPIPTASPPTRKQKVKLNRLYRQDIKAESGVWTASETQTASDVHTVSDAHTAAQSEGVLEVSTRAKVVRRSARRHDDLPGTTTNKPTQNKDENISACLCGRTYKNTRGLKTHQRSCPSTTT